MNTNIELKLCLTCKNEKSIDEFLNDSRKINKKHSCCLNCRRIKYQKYYLKNRYQCLKKNKEFFKNHPKYRIEHHIRYYKKNKNKLLTYSKRYFQIKIKKDPIFRLRFMTTKSIRRKIKNQSTIKRFQSINLLGCSWQEFKNYFESKFAPDMNWNAFMQGKIHIDHIRPCSSFDLTDPEQQKECFHFSNLQPLWAADNLKKSNKLNWSIT